MGFDVGQIWSIGWKEIMNKDGLYQTKTKAHMFISIMIG
jgi:hypothetical protein